jgi:hypothetical protein
LTKLFLFNTKQNYMTTKKNIKKTVLNPHQEYHEYLKNHNSIDFANSIKFICEDLGISDTSYYRKIKNPASFSPADKTAIAAVYKMPVHFIFPDMKK